MSTIKDLFDDVSEFEDLLTSAEDNAETGWEMNFVEETREKYETWGKKMFLSDKQLSILERIAGEE